MNFYKFNIPERSFIIPNPVHIPPLQWKDEETKNIIVSVGRIDIGHKRQDVLVKAYAIVHHQHPEARLKIVGDGNDKERLKNLVSDLGLSENIFFTGQVKDVYSEMIDSKIFVLTSDFEGIPNALLEAMALGLPVISTDCTPGGAAFLIEDNKYGRLVPRGDVEKVAEQIVSLLEDKNARIKLGEAARRHVCEFKEDNIIKQWDEVINKMLERV